MLLIRGRGLCDLRDLHLHRRVLDRVPVRRRAHHHGLLFHRVHLSHLFQCEIEQHSVWRPGQCRHECSYS